MTPNSTENIPTYSKTEEGPAAEEIGDPLEHQLDDVPGLGPGIADGLLVLRPRRGALAFFSDNHTSIITTSIAWRESRALGPRPVNIPMNRPTFALDPTVPSRQ